MNFNVRWFSNFEFKSHNSEQGYYRLLHYTNLNYNHKDKSVTSNKR